MGGKGDSCQERGRVFLGFYILPFGSLFVVEGQRGRNAILICIYTYQNSFVTISKSIGKIRVFRYDNPSGLAGGRLRGRLVYIILLGRIYTPLFILI